MSKEDLGVLGGIIVLLAHLPLYIGIVRKNTQPSVATWGMWSVMLTATLVTQFLAGKEDPWGMLAAASGTVLAFVLLLFYGERTWSKFDTKCLILSSVGILTWMTTGAELGQLAFLASLMVAGMPTVRNAWKTPEKESRLVWGIFTTGFLLTVLSIQEWSWVNYSDWIQPVTSTAFNLSVFLSASLRRR